MFNAVRLLHNAADPPVPVKTYFFSGQADLSALAGPVTRIVKSHEIGDPETELELSRRAARKFSLPCATRATPSRR